METFKTKETKMQKGMELVTNLKAGPVYRRTSLKGKEIYVLPFLGDLNYSVYSRSMSLRESRREFEGDDFGRYCEYTVYRRGATLSYADYVMEGYGNGYGPSDDEIVLGFLAKHVEVDFGHDNCVFEMLMEFKLYLRKIRNDARKSSDSFIYGYEGT